GRSPCAQFNGLYYLHSNEDVLNSGINPLLHYLRYGRFENRRPMPDQDYLEFLEMKTIGLQQLLASLPEEQEWQNLIPRANITNAIVDIIIPVYKGYAETVRCLYTLLIAKSDIQFEVIVIDDASTEKALVDLLKELANLNLFTLLVHSHNLGFVGTVNHGMLLHSERDVLLLNSDTEVYDYWLDRLYFAAKSDSRIASVTPLSNNATICSYPHFLHDNPYPLELTYAELDQLAAIMNRGQKVEAPTAVGFCMYINRNCLKQLGYFDETAFGKGYGEENDFCQRAIESGWKNIIAADVFVRHWGAVSFQGERAKRVNEALKVLQKRYPSYQQQVQQFIHHDPLKIYREQLDWGRLIRWCQSQNILIINHNRGGGSERCVQETIAEINKIGQGVFLMRPLGKNSSQVQLLHPRIQSLRNLPALDLTQPHFLIQALKELRISQIQIHGLVDFVAHSSDILLEIAEQLNIDVEVMIHDYKPICPRINLIDHKGYYCGEPNEDECNRCLKERGSPFEVNDIRHWRQMRGRLLARATKVSVPNEDVAIRLQRYFPDISFSISPHDSLHLENICILPPKLTVAEKLRIVVIGAIGEMKGYSILMSCAYEAKKRQLPLEFILMGYSLDDECLKKAGVLITGRYNDYEAEEKLVQLNGHVVWLPSLWPETYSYTLSIALMAKKPVFAFDLGAIAQRLRFISADQQLMPLSLSQSPNEINELFIQYLQQHLIQS
ncbi:MAG: hypothetical protein RL637_402, partial [Pseudomonadota bacterium]